MVQAWTETTDMNTARFSWYGRFWKLSHNTVRISFWWRYPGGYLHTILMTEYGTEVILD